MSDISKNRHAAFLPPLRRILKGMIHGAQMTKTCLRASLRMGVLNGRANLHDGLARVDRTAGESGRVKRTFC